MQQNYQKDLLHKNQLSVTGKNTKNTCQATYMPGAMCFNARTYKFITVVIIFFLSSFSVRAQQIDYAVHANIIYHFTKYIDWPDNKKSGDFIIGIIGDSPLYEELQKIVPNKMVGNHQIVLKKFSSSATSFNCHILFISDDKKKNIKKIVSATAGNPILIVSESDGLAKKGSCINFVIVNERLKLEINKNNIDKQNLSIATELLGLGIIVKN